MHLEDHSRVCIIGGGPAGCFAALHLLRLSSLHDLHLEVLIFEPRDCTRAGPSGCNRCAGVLSSRLWGNLSELGLSIPDRIIQSDLQSYNIHLDQGSIHLERPDPSRRIISVYRGGGPRLVAGLRGTSFDHFLLSQAVRLGAQHITRQVRQVAWEGTPVVYTREERYPASLVVLATGINSRAPLSAEFGYRQPRSEVMAQDEVDRPAGWDPTEVNAYFRHPPGLSFGAIIPKGNYLNISLLGKGFSRHTVNEFIQAQNLSEQLNYNPHACLCGCNPRIAVSAAGRYFGDRWVAVGDAAVARLYKDGIGSAYQTSRQAMMVAVEQGISSSAFRQHYAPLCRSIDYDNRYGQLLYRLWNFVLNSPRLLRAWRFAIDHERSQPPQNREHIRILWGMLTGDEPYQQLFWRGMRITAVLPVMRALFIGKRAG